MSDDEAARLRGLAQAEHDALEAILDADPPVPRELRMNYGIAFDALAQEIDGETILKLLDERDALRRERDAIASERDAFRRGQLQERLRERDAAMALLREVRNWDSFGIRAPLNVIAEIDAILGGDEGA